MIPIFVDTVDPFNIKYMIVHSRTTIHGTQQNYNACACMCVCVCVCVGGGGVLLHRL